MNRHIKYIFYFCDGFLFTLSTERCGQSMLRPRFAGDGMSWDLTIDF